MEDKQERRVCTDLYADGGLIGCNGDPDLLGVYCFVQVDAQGEYITHETGLVKPQDGVRVENNYAELCAVVRGLRSVGVGWRGNFYSDNRNALGWVFPAFINTGREVRGNFTRRGIPPTLRRYIEDSLFVTYPLEYIKATLLDGHPTPAELAAGIGHSGKPVSKWNAFCDSHCNAFRLVYELEKAKDGARPAFRLKPSDYARLLPEVKERLQVLGYPYPKTKPGSLPRAGKAETKAVVTA